METCLSRAAAKSVQRIISRGIHPSALSRHVRLNSSTADSTMSWAEYLALRRSRHLWQKAATIPGAVTGLFGGAAYFGSLETDPMKPIMGIDPFMFYGACTAATMGLGVVLGPTAGSFLWRFKNSSTIKAFDARDAEFFQRIARNRVDASLQSPTKPVPDYYGEKVGNLHQYRTWLRDQGKYRRRAILPEE